MRVFVLCLALLLLPDRLRGDAAELSDAMKAAASGDGTPVEGQRSHDSDAADDDDSSGESFAGEVVGSMIGGFFSLFHGADYRDTEYAWQLPVDAGYVLPLNGNIRSFTRFSVTPLSLEGERALFGFYFNGGLVRMKEGSLPDEATSGAWTVGVGAAFRYYFVTPQKSPLNPYLAAQIGWQGLSWNYRHPVSTDEGELYSDGLSAFDCYAGCGLAFNRSHWFSLYGEAGFGGMFFASQTREGFHNDVFDDLGYFSVKAGMSLKF